MEKERILKNILFVFGIILGLVSLAMLIYQIYNVSVHNISEIYGPDKKKATIYLVIEFSTIIFRIILSFYAIYGFKHIDDVINPLFTFTVLYFIFVVIETINFFVYGGFSISVTASINTITDIVVAFFFGAVTLTFKIDDWKMISEEDL